MYFVSFNPLRTLGFPNTKYVKATAMLQEAELIKKADWLLFPEYWQVNSLVYGWHKKIFPSHSTYLLGHNKIEMTRFFQAVVPENTPYTLILANQAGIKEEILEQISFPFVAKKVRSSEGRGVWLIKNKQDLDRYLQENNILYLQEYLPIDRDLRVVVIGNEIYQAYWRIGQEGFKNNVAQGGKISYENIPAGALELVAKVAKIGGINHAGFDVAVVGQQYYLLEFNPLFGNQGLKQSTQEINQDIYSYLLAQNDNTVLAPQACRNT